MNESLRLLWIVVVLKVQGNRATALEWSGSDVVNAIDLVDRMNMLTLSGMNLMIDSTLGREVGVELVSLARMVAFDH